MPTISRALLFSSLLILGLVSAAKAQFAQKPFGIGLQAGDRSGITAKLWLGNDDRTAIQVAVGSHWYHGYLYDGPFGPFITADVVYRFAGTQSGAVKFGFHVGLGLGWTRYERCYRDFFGR